MKDLEGAYTTALGAENSALKENDTYLQSIQGRIDLFNNSVQTMWANTLNSDAVKWIVDLGTSVVKAVDSFGLIKTALIGVLGYLLLIKKQNPINIFNGITSNMQNMSNALARIQNTKKALQTSDTRGNDFAQILYAEDTKNLTAAQTAHALSLKNISSELIRATLAQKGYNEEQIEAAMTQNQVAKLTLKRVTVTGADVAMMAQQNGITLSKNASNYLLENSEKQLTFAISKRKAKQAQLNEEDREQLNLLREQALLQNGKGSFKEFFRSNFTQIASMVTSAIAAVVQMLPNAIEKLEKTIEQFDQLSANIDATQQKINDKTSELETIQDRIAELQRKKELSTDEARELSALRSQSDELERQIDQHEHILELQDAQHVESSMSAINAMLKTTQADSESIQKTWKTTATILGGVVGVAAGIAGALWTGGGSLALTGASITAITTAIGAGIMAGSAIGEKAGAAAAVKDADMIQWYESYRDAILEAEAEAAAAEKKYLNDASDKNYEAWKTKSDQVNNLRDTLYNNLTEMQDYISQLDYANEDHRQYIDAYNGLLAEIDMQSKEGNIDAQINSVAALKDEYEKLSRGVSANGKNIALTAEEYARYQSIVDQITRSAPQLIHGYDAEENALLNRNTIIEDYIKLKKEEQRLAAYDLVSGSAIADSYKKERKAYLDAKEDIYLGDYFEDYDNANDVYSVIQEVIGIGISGEESYEDYIVNHYEEITAKSAEINQKMQDKFKADYEGLGLLAGDAAQRAADQVVAYNEFLSGLTAWMQDDLDNVMIDTKNRLLNIPASYTKYYDLSGNNKNFLDIYVRTHFNDLTIDSTDIDAIQKQIQNTSELLFESAEAQSLIDSLFAIDKDNTQISEYRKAINDALDQLIKDGIITKEQRQEMYAGFIPNDAEISTMIEAVWQKLKLGEKFVSKNLTESDLRIAYKVTLDADISSISEDELQRRIAQYKAENFSISNYADDITAINEELSTFKNALEKLDSGTFTIADFVELIKQFPDLAKGVDVSSKKFSGLSKNLKKAMRTTPDKLIDELEDLRDELKAAGESTTDIDQLIESMRNLPTETVKELSKEYITLADAIDEARIAQNEIQKAMQEDPNSGYQTRDEANTYMQEAMQRGEIGSESNLWNVAKETYGFERGADEPLEAAADRLAKLVALRDKWFQEDKDGNNTFAGAAAFAQDIEEAVQENTRLQELLQWNYNEATGVLNFDFDNANWNEIVKLLGETENAAGLTSAEFRDMLVWLGQFYDIKWQDGNDLALYLQEVGGAADTIAEKYADVEDTVQNYLKTDQDLQKYLSANDVEIEDIIELKVDDEEFKKLPQTVQDILTQYHKIKEQYEKDPFAVNYQLEQDITTNMTEGLTEKTRAALSQLTDVVYDTKTDTTFIDFDALRKSAEEAGMDVDRLMQLIHETAKSTKLVDLNITEEDPLGLLSLQQNLSSTVNYIKSLGIAVNELEDGTITLGVESLIDTLYASGWSADQIKAYIDTLNAQGYTFTYTTKEQKTEKINVDDAEASQIIEDLLAQKQGISKGTETVTVDLAGDALTGIDIIKNNLATISGQSYTVTINRHTNEYQKKFTWSNKTGQYETQVDGTAHAQGTAYAGGSWGAKETGTSLVGELGPEIIVRKDRWFTVGDNGAEFTQIQRGDIVFNHRQAKSLLENGYVTSRGKAYASGTAYASGMGAYRKYLFDGDGGYAKYDVNGKILADHSDKLSGNLSDAADAAGDFAESLDWIEIRMEEIDESIGLLNAQLENAVTWVDKNNKIDEIIQKNHKKIADALAGADYYEKYAKKFFNQIPAEYRKAAQNGAIAITDFVGEANEQVVEAIQNYRDYIQKAADLKQTAEETKTENRDLAIQRFDNAYEAGSVRADVEASQTEKLQNRVDLDEAQGEITSDAYYYAMMENSNKTIEYLTKARDNMQKELNEAVKRGEIIRGSNEWYELVNEMYGVQAEIDEATIELEEFQNAVNDLHWERFEQLTNTLDNLQDETQNLIDLMENEDLFTAPDDENGWGEDQVQWTKEGIASLGLYAQQMEIAEFTARQYSDEIKKLTKDYEAGLYSESEYKEKLEELKDGQYDAISSYEDAKKAIVDLNKTRIDEVRNGIEKQIDAYSKLIEKQKESLNSQKDLYDFQKSVSDQQKTISDLQRKLDALSGDSSASAAARKRQIAAELAEARAALEETYFNESIENQQDALDRELEDYEEAQNKKIEDLDAYLENIEQVVADSLSIVQANASGVYDTLNGKADEYNLHLSQAILQPWNDGALAVSDYQTTFDTAMSSTTDQLEALKAKWQEVIDVMAQAGEDNVASINKVNASYAQQKKEEPKASSSSTNTNTNKKQPTNTIKVGGKINAGSAKIYGYAGATNGQVQYFKKDPIYTVLQEKNGYLLVRHHSLKSGSTGWFKKSDVKAYAKGTTGVKNDQLAWIDEMGLEELVMHAGPDGRLQYLTKGTSVLPSDLTERIMDLAMNPQTMIDQNRPTISAPHITNNEITIDASIGELISIKEYNGGDLDKLEQMVSKQFDKHIKDLNNSLKRFTR